MIWFVCSGDNRDRLLQTTWPIIENDASFPEELDGIVNTKEAFLSNFIFSKSSCDADITKFNSFSTFA